MAFIFESIILFPLETNTCNNSVTQINKCQHLFRTGRIKTLYETSRNVVSKIPLEKLTRNISESNMTRNRCAQIAANNDNYRSDIDRIATDTSIAINTASVVNILKGL